RLELKFASRATCSATGRWATFLCRQARQARQLPPVAASCRQFSPDTGQHSVSISLTLVKRQ
ncbi:hypothetical protein A2U01_0065638, partial [Trifolium medium]|nr:hypothetical protein [Trifolium medium]